MIISLDIFSKMVRTGTTWGQFEESLKESKDDLDCLTLEDKKFIFGIYSREFNLWDDSSRSLGEFDLGRNYKSETPSDDFIKWIEDVTKDYCEGIIRCSDCGKRIKLKSNEIGGRYFAGIYCKECWEDTWSAIEAREDYN